MELTIYQRIILLTLSRIVWLLYKSETTLGNYLYGIAIDGKIEDSFDNVIGKIG